MRRIGRLLVSVMAAVIVANAVATGVSAAGSFTTALLRCDYLPDGTLFGQVTGGSVTGGPPNTTILVDVDSAVGYSPTSWLGLTDAAGSTPVRPVISALLEYYPMTMTAYADVNLSGSIDPDDPMVGGPAVVPVLCPPYSLEYLLTTAVSDGTLSGGEASSLEAKVDAAGASYDRYNLQAAIKQLEAFVTQVEALSAAGRIATGTGNELIAAAEARLVELRALL